MAKQIVEQSEVVTRLENLLSAIEIYRDVEQQAINRIQELMQEKGITISREEIMTSTKESIRERYLATKHAREEREAKEQETELVAENVTYQTSKSMPLVISREEEVPCRR